MEKLRTAGSTHHPARVAIPDLELRCPACSGEVQLPEINAYPGKRVGCLHCGAESWLDREQGEEGAGRWVLLSEWLDDEP